MTDEAGDRAAGTVLPFPMPDSQPDDDGYDGAALLVVDGVETEVRVTLRGHFDPVSGRYSWYGRVAASPEVSRLVGSGARAVRLRTPHGEVDTRLADVDPWGRPRVEGFGAAPFAVLATPPDDDDTA